jgi:hypothetical protein
MSVEVRTVTSKVPREAARPLFDPWSPWLDLAIALGTKPVLLTGRDANGWYV